MSIFSPGREERDSPGGTHDLGDTVARISAGADERDAHPSFPEDSFLHLAAAGALALPVSDPIGEHGRRATFAEEWRVLRAVARADGSVGRRFERALEAGASISVFTKMLAARCDELLAVDVSERAVAEARKRLSGREHVHVERRTLPEEMPRSPFDLIVASEVLYYFTSQEMLAVLGAFERELAPGGTLLAVHWRRETKIYPLQGDEVHELLSEHTQLQNTKTIAEQDYRLDLFEDLA